MSIIILHPGAYLQIGDAGQDLVEHTCASASALHVQEGRGVVVVVVRLQTESDQSWQTHLDLRPACRRSSAVPTCRCRSERAFCRKCRVR